MYFIQNNIRPCFKSFDLISRFRYDVLCFLLEHRCRNPDKKGYFQMTDVKENVIRGSAYQLTLCLYFQYSISKIVSLNLYSMNVQMHEGRCE